MNFDSLLLLILSLCPSLFLSSCRPRAGRSDLKKVAGSSSSVYLYNTASLQPDFEKSLNHLKFKISPSFCLKSGLEVSSGYNFILFFDYQCEKVDAIIKQERDPPYAFRLQIEESLIAESTAKGNKNLIAVDQGLNVVVGQATYTDGNPEVTSLCWRKQFDACLLVPGVNDRLDSIFVRKDGTPKSSYVRLAHSPFYFVEQFKPFVKKRSFTSRLPDCSLAITSVGKPELEKLLIELQYVSTTRNPNCPRESEVLKVICKSPKTGHCERVEGGEGVDFGFVDYRILIYDSQLKETFYYAIDPVDVQFIVEDGP